MSALLWVAYVVGAIAFWRAAYRVLYRWRLREWPSQPWDSQDRYFCTIVTTLMTAIWPFVLVTAAAVLALSLAARGVEP